VKKIFIFLVLVMIAVPLLSGCGSPTASTTSTQTATTSTTAPAASTQAIKTGGTLKLLYPFSPTSTPGWPGDTTNLQKLWTCWVVFEGLVKLDPNGQPLPWLATSWKWSPDNTYIDFTLRQNVKFSDGTVFNADAVKLDFDQLITDKDSATTTWDHTEKIDDYTFRLYIKSFSVSFWSSICGFDTVIVSPTVLKQGVDYAKEHPVGTGPFLFQSLQKDVQMSFVKNPNYWQPGKPYLDGIDMITVTEARAIYSSCSLAKQTRIWPNSASMFVPNSPVPAS
jgi:peptide/nickel transport system substrate-binding protein